MDRWIRTADVMPPDGEVVNAMDSGGHVQKLKRNGRLWWFPDSSMYVYFTPTCWQPLPPGDIQGSPE